MSQEKTLVALRRGMTASARAINKQRRQIDIVATGMSRLIDRLEEFERRLVLLAKSPLKRR